MSELARKIQAYPGVLRKRRIGALTSRLPAPTDASVVAGFGEDCAVLELASLKDEYLLLGLDAIIPDLVKKAPRFAGYSSVLVNVLDVVAMAGHPVAVVDFLGSVGEKFEAEVAKGMAEASEHLQVPIVGGHFHPDDPSPSVAVAILGRVRKQDCTFSHTARVGDDLLFAADLSGKRLKEYPMAWSPLRDKSKIDVIRRFTAVRDAASRGFLHAAKDASNPGIIGTVGMMLEASGVGGFIDVDRIPRPDRVPLEDWVLMYQGCGFVFAADANEVEQLTEIMGEHGLTCASIGQVSPIRRLEVARGDDRAMVFDFTKGGVTGIPPASA